MKSYINVYQDSARTLRHIYIEDGKVFDERVPFKPFLGVHAMSSESTSWTDMYGKPARIKVFDSIPEMKEWKKENDVGLDILGDISPTIQFIATKYRKDIQIQKQGMIIWNIDIEVDVKAGEGFPRPESAAFPINAITIQDMVSKTYTTFSLKDYNNIRKDVSYVRCHSENDLINRFLHFFETQNPHIITGWNIQFFDIPYIVNRVNRVMGPEDVKKLSRERNVSKREATNSMGQKQLYYALQGHIIWDYYDLYKKYQLEPRERYTLSFIAQTELGKDKIDYSEHGNLGELYENDFQKFIDYNIEDTTLVGDLDDKLGYIDLAISIMYKAKCTPDAIFGTVQPWDCLIYNEMLNRKILCPPNSRGIKEEFPGGYVKTPITGMHEWVVVYDIVSSYPNQIRSFNISPETIVSDRDLPDELRRVGEKLAFIKDPDDTDKDVCPCENIDDIEKYTELFQKYDVCFTANGKFFRRSKEGIIPSIYSKLFNERLGYKKMGKEKKKEYNNTKNPVTKHEMEQADLYSYTLKILLNSGYGSLANIHSRYFDLRIAEAITTNGQTCCRGVSNYLDNKYADITRVYNDTDSCFYNMSGILKKRFPKGVPNNQECLDFLLKFNKTVFEPSINGFFERLSVAMNMRELTIAMEAECIADISIHTAKKRYIMSKVWDEGVFHVEKPKLKIRGVEIVRTSTPQVVRDKLKEAVNLIFETKSNDALIEYVEQVKKDFFKMSFEDIAFPRSVTFSDYTLSSKGIPIGVRAALIYNKFIKDNKLTDKYQLISDGDKIKFILIKKPNKLGSNVVGIPTTLPEELAKHIQIDYDEQFAKTFIAPLESIFAAIGWTYEKKANLLDFFS